jgi:hypothetical protein
MTLERVMIDRRCVATWS